MELAHNIISQSPKITLSECIKIIQKKLKSIDFNIINFKLVELDSRNGFLGEHRRLNITIKRNAGNQEEIHCFAKFLPENPAQIDFAVICGVFKKEVFMYEELFPIILNNGINYLKQVIPECYYTKEDYILVFEDVTKKGYEPLSKYNYLDYNHVLVTLKSMAKLHASSIIFEEKKSDKLNRNYRLLDDYENYFYETFYVNNLAHKGGQGVHAAIKGIYTGLTLYPEFKKSINDKKFRSNISKICLNIFELVKPSKQYRNCLCHGDLWSTNIMIKYNNNIPVDCLMLDFQTIRYCPPAHDFMSFIYLTTTRQFRKEHLINLQHIYYDELNILLNNYGYTLNKIIPFEEFLESCELQKQFAIVQTVTYVQLTQVKDQWIAECIKNTELWDEALYADRSKMVIDNCKIDSNYRHVLGEAFTDLYEICDGK